MKALVLGATGMLGHKVAHVLGDSMETWVAFRGTFADYEPLGLFDRRRSIDRFHADSDDSISDSLGRSAPDVVVNCVGIVKQRPEGHDPVEAVTINGLLPHKLSAACSARGIRMVHLSTDCVFSGRTGMYTEDAVPDPIDLYGRSKLVGEVGEPHLTIRTSLIGRELSGAQGLVEWFLNARSAKVSGFTQAIFSGFPTLVLSEIIRDIVIAHPELVGVYHVSSDPITKYDLLVLLREQYGRDVVVDPDDTLRLDRSLDSTRFRTLTEFKPDSWVKMVERMAADDDTYARSRSLA